MTSSDPIPPPPPAMPPEPLPAPLRESGPRFGSIVVGLIILAIGLWYFADRTLGLSLPRLDTDQLWPFLVIALGVWIIVRPHRR